MYPSRCYPYQAGAIITRHLLYCQPEMLVPYVYELTHNEYHPPQLLT
jgi:hypothetical protein